jgi:Tol biopolymer transport system component
MSGSDERLRAALRDLAAEFPPYDHVPVELVPRARRGRRITVMADAAIVGLVVVGIVIGVRELVRPGHRAVHHAPPVAHVIPGPTGDQIAFMRTPTLDSLNPTWSDIYVMNADGTGMHRVLGTSQSSQTAYASPAWSPDGTKLALIADPVYAYAGEGELALANADGSHVDRPLIEPPASAPSWSPDGRQIAFTNGQGDAIDIVNADGTGLRQLVPARNARVRTTVGEPSWSPDGRQIAFVGGWAEVGSIYVVDVRGGGLRRLTNGSAMDDTPAWSPDGRWIAFSSRGDIYLMRGNGMHVRRVVSCVQPRCEWANAPTWSPDGEAIAFQESIDGGRSQQIFVVTLSTGRVRQLTRGPLDNVDPSWQLR